MMPENKAELFEKIVRTGFDPMKTMIEYGNLDSLTESDIDKITHVINHNLKTWVKFMRHVKEQPGKDGG